MTLLLLLQVQLLQLMCEARAHTAADQVEVKDQCECLHVVLGLQGKRLSGAVRKQCQHNHGHGTCALENGQRGEE